MLLARLSATFDREVSDRCLLIRSSRIVKIFVWSDFCTFGLQGLSTLSGSQNPTLQKVGNTVRTAFDPGEKLADRSA